jgi:hypothetical protein
MEAGTRHCPSSDDLISTSGTSVNHLPRRWPSGVGDHGTLIPGMEPAAGLSTHACARRQTAGKPRDPRGSKEVSKRPDPAQGINVMTEVIDDEQEMLLADDEVEIEVAADTGAGAHCAHPRHLPDSVEVLSDKLRSFNGAGGEPIKHYGRANVRMQQEDGKHISQEVQVMEVTRPLHSISMVCDNDFDAVFTKTEGLVIPAGLLDEVLAVVKQKIVARYRRKGGLYVAKMRVKDPRAKRPSPAKASPFAGRGTNR